MPRHARTILGGYAYHVLNRANGRLRLFKKDADFAAFEQLVAEAYERVPLRILSYVVMGNHWHFVVWPKRGQGEQVTDFFRWLKELKGDASLFWNDKTARVPFSSPEWSKFMVKGSNAMALTLDDYRFIGLANTVAMEEFSASFNDNSDGSACLALLEEYKNAGSPADNRSWLRERLASLFVCHTIRPKWVESGQMWPFLNGKPMTFIRQLSVEENHVANANLVSNVVLYLFGMRIPVNGGWQMSYQVVQQHSDLP